MKPKVSVIVPSYNHAAYLRQCIESVIWQSLNEWELIVVDDWSSDDSLGVASRFEDPRLKVFRNDRNLGTYATLNAGIDRASADFIAILNSDDLWLPRKLELQIGLLDARPDCPFCYTDGHMIDEEGVRIDSESRPDDYPRTEVQDLLPYLLFENNVLASSLVFRRGAVRFNDSLRYSGDWVALIDLAERGRAAYVTEPVTAWRQHPANTYTRLLNVVPEEIRVREAILDRSHRWRGKTEDSFEIDSRLAKCALALAALYIRIGNRRFALKNARLALKFAPSSRRARRMRVLAALPLSVSRKRLWGESKPLAVADTIDDTPVFLT